jgi:aryl-alcohol dehydrogenase-like predicted oxidoreductase
VRTRSLGQTGTHVSELSLGTWGLSGEAYGSVDPAERDRVIDRALELGITTFETADVYGRGAIEKCLGERLAGKAGTFVVTKIGTFRPPPPEQATPDTPQGTYKRFDAAYLRESVVRSRDRLRREKIDVVLLHNPSATTMSRGEASAVMKELKHAGAVGTWGVSAGDSYVARTALAHGAEVVEVPYNVFFSRELHDLAGDLTKAGAGVLARSVLSYGILAGQFAPSHTFSDDDHRSSRWTRPEFETRVRQLDAVRPLVTGNVLTLRAAALRFVLSNEMVSSAVLGPKDVSQLEQLVREAGTEPPYLTTEALAQLANDLSRAGVVT